MSISLAAKLALVVSFLAGSVSCAHPTEIQRVTSPDGLVEATLVRDDGGFAMSDINMFVYLNMVGSDDTPTRVFWAQGGGFKLVWRENQVLNIEYERALIFDFQNLFETWTDPSDIYWVEVRLAPTKELSLYWNEATTSDPNGRKRPIF